jgi:carbon monoxide dehydrogenase subunit G
MELTNEFEVAVPLAEAWAVLTDVERIAPCLPGAELKEIEGDEYRGVVKVKVGPITASYKGVAHFEELDEAAHRAVLKAEGRETRGQGNASATITATLSPSGSGTKVQVATDLAITGKVAQFGRGVLADVSGKLLDQFVQNLETMVLAPTADAGSDAGEGAETAEAAVSEPAGDAESKGESEAKADTGSAAKAGGPSANKPKAERTGTIKARPAAGSAGKAARDSNGKAATTNGDGNAAEGAQPEEGGDEPEPSSPTVRHIQSVPAEPVDLMSVAGPSLARRLVPFASIAGALFLARIVVYALRRRKK